jgi:hypothetical protein
MLPRDTAINSAQHQVNPEGKRIGSNSNTGQFKVAAIFFFAFGFVDSTHANH